MKSVAEVQSVINTAGPMRDEIIDMSFRQEELIAELAKLSYETDNSEKILAALGKCLKILEELEENYKLAFTEFEKAAYSKAIEHFNL